MGPVAWESKQSGDITAGGGAAEPSIGCIGASGGETR